MNKKQVATHAVWAVMTVVGTFLMAVGFSLFLAPKNIVAGGFSGIALILSNALERFFNIKIPRGLIYIALNVPLFIIGWKHMGTSFALLSMLGMLTYSLFIEIVSFDIKVDDSLLCALYGGIFNGIGIGLVVRGNSSTGGTDLLGNILHRKNEKITVGKVVIILNVVVIGLNVLYTKTVLVAMYAIISIFIEGLICDYISEGPRSIKAYYVISDKYEEISEKILTELHRGCTCIEAKGMFSKSDRKMLLCLISRRQVNDLNEIVFSVDSNAFVFSTNCKDAIGNGFSKPQKTKKQSELYRIISGEKIEKTIVAKPKVNIENKDCVDKKENIEKK